MFDSHLLLSVVFGLIVIVLSLSVHEFAHAAAGRVLGDRTAEEQGRLTLNPASHIDPWGTLLLPALCMLSGLPSFGWAKPVPYDPRRFRAGVSRPLGSAFVAVAGPTANIIMAILMAIVVHLADDAARGSALATAGAIARTLAATNVALAIFNMIPVPPLDGSGVLLGVLPRSAARSLAIAFERYSFVLFMVVVIAAGQILRRPVYFTLELLGVA